MKYILAIDQGTTSSRAIIFDQNLQAVCTSQKETTQIFPNSGWVEHNPLEIWQSTVETCGEVLCAAGVPASDIVSIGITNQRETTVVWDRHTGQPIYNAIVWQDRRTSKLCKQLKADGFEVMVTHKTGLLLDPYFSGTKVKWLLDNVEGAREKAQNGDLLFGTIDCYLLWKFTGGKKHVTDATNASRTMLYNIRSGDWDAEICEILDVPLCMLPEVYDCAADFGTTEVDILGASIPITGMAGDQQAATIGQACFEPGMLKSTYGTGCFALLNTGNKLVQSQNRLLGTIAYQLNGQTTYALEGSIFVAGSVVQWLRDGLGIIKDASDTERMAQKANENEQIYLVPAFTGMGAPYWDADCRGAIYGVTRNTGPNEFARAALESVGYQTLDLLEAMQADWTNYEKGALKVDGGMSANNWAMQFLSDMIATKVVRPKVLETTALGVALLAGMHVGFYPDKDAFSNTMNMDKEFSPLMSADIREAKYLGWKDAVSRTLSQR